MSRTGTGDFHDDQFEGQLQRRLAPFLESNEGRKKLEQLTNEARGAMRCVRRIGLDEKDAINSAVRTALRRERVPEAAPAPEEDIWGWFECLFWKRCKKYRDSQRTNKHGWTLETDHFTQDESGSAAIADPHPNEPLDEDDVEGHIHHVLALINSEHFTADQRVLAEFLAKGFTPKEIAEMLGKSPDTIRRRIRKLRGKIDPNYKEPAPNKEARAEDRDGRIDIPGCD